jgi:hypothetical protein
MLWPQLAHIPPAELALAVIAGVLLVGLLVSATLIILGKLHECAVAGKTADLPGLDADEG